MVTSPSNPKNEERRDPWDYVCAFDYQRALYEYTVLFEQNGKTPHLTNRGTVYLTLKEYDKALRDFLQVVSLEPAKHHASGHFFHIAVCQWCLGNIEAALDAVRLADAAPYTDAAGGVEPPALLLYFGLRLSDETVIREATKLLRKHARRKGGMWPAGIAPFLLKQIDFVTMKAQINETMHPTLFARYVSQMYFYAATRCLMEGGRTGYDDNLRRSAQITDPSVILEHEHHLASFEIGRDTV